MKRNIFSKITAVLLTAALAMPAQMNVYASGESEISAYANSDVSEDTDKTSGKAAALRGSEEYSDEEVTPANPAEAAEPEPEAAEAPDNEAVESNADSDGDLSAESVSDDVNNSSGQTEIPAEDAEGTVTIIHNEGRHISETFADEDELCAMDFCEDPEAADGEIIPVLGYEITASDLTREELVGASNYPSEYYPTMDTVVGSQGSKQTCWVYAAMTCAERSLIKGGLTDSINLSEKHLLYGYYNRDGDNGKPAQFFSWYNTTGSFYMAVAAMADLLGAADENKYPYTYDALSKDQYTDDIAHLEEAIFLPNYPTDSSSWKQDLWNTVTDRLKGVIMENGAVWVSVFSANKHSTTEWYTEWPNKSVKDSDGNVTVTYLEKPGADHAVAIEGWNDEKVIPGAEKPGAWYVHNSWGDNWGEGGHCWVSYEDASLNNPVSYRMEQSVPGKMLDTEVFSHTGTGFCGKMLNSTHENYGVNVFTTDHAVSIDSVGFYNVSNANNYQVELITNIPDLSDPVSGTVAASAGGSVPGNGFHRVRLNKSVAIGRGETFAVKAVCSNDAGKQYTTFEGPTSNLRDTFCKEGESYFYYKGIPYDCATTENLSRQSLSKDYRSPCIYAYGNEVQGLQVIGEVKTAYLGDTFALEAYLADDTDRDIKVDPIWTSDEEGVTVSEDGTVTVTDSALTGHVTVIADYAGVQGKYSFDVIADASESDLSGLRLIGVPDSALVIGPEEKSDEGGCAVITKAAGDAPELGFIFEKAETGYYRIENFYTGLMMTLDEEDGVGVSYITQMPRSESDAQLWRILKAEGGFIIQNKSSGSCLEIYESQQDEGEFIVAVGQNLQAASIWTITETMADIGKATMTVPASAALIDGEATVDVKVVYGYRTLEPDTHYTISFSDNEKPGTATVTAAGTGYMAGTKKGTFIAVKSAETIISGKNYMIVPVKGPTRAVTVEKGSVLPNARIYLSAQQNSEAQKFIFTKNSGGTYTLTDQKSDYVAGIRNNQTSSASSLETQPDTGIKFQRWTLKKHDDGSYSILNNATNMAVYLVGGKITAGTYIAQAAYSGSINQRFYLVETTATPHTYSHSYTIRAAGKTSLALEITNASKTSGANARLFTYSGGASQKFRLMYSGNGYYRIMNENSGKVLGIKGDTKENGANVRQATWSNASGQRWKVVSKSDGSVVLQSALGTALDIYGGTIKSATNVDSWAVNSTAAQKWKMVKIS